MAAAEEVERLSGSRQPCHRILVLRARRGPMPSPWDTGHEFPHCSATIEQSHAKTAPTQGAFGGKSAGAVRLRRPLVVGGARAKRSSVEYERAAG